MVGKHQKSGSAKKKILNVGCGRQTYGTHFVDVYPHSKRVVRCDTNHEKLPFPDNFFDEVYSSYFLEHCCQLYWVVSEMKRVLKSGGRLKIITDNAGWILFHIPVWCHYGVHNLTDKEKRRRKGSKDKHYCLFTPLHLKNLLDEVGGFEHIEIEYKYEIRNPKLKFLEPVFKLASMTFLRNMLTKTLVLTAQKKISKKCD